jgi:hypothetical protein
MRLQRLGCDCRAVSMTALTTTSSFSPLKTEVSNIAIRLREPEEADEAPGQSMLAQLTPAIMEALKDIYSACTAATAFPVFVLPPAEVSSEETLEYIRSVHVKLTREFGMTLEVPANQPAILFLPASDSVPNSVISLFETAPDLPAAVVLAFDSPRSRVPKVDTFDDEPDPQQVQRQLRFGKPGAGVIALLLTNENLPSMLAAVSHVDQENGHYDNMTPFWQKEALPAGNLSLLARTCFADREQLAELPVLSRIHRSAFQQANRQQPGVLELSRLAQLMLERAQVNAGLLDNPFVFDDKALDASANEDNEVKQPAWGCIVHNAGSADTAGKRLTALGTALYHFHIDLNPVSAESATNIVIEVGDLGRASGVAQLALGVAHAAQRIAPVLVAEFVEGNGIAFAFIMPPAPSSR